MLDDGRIDTKQQSLDAVQKKLAEKLRFAVPRIPYICRALTHEQLRCLAVIVYGSPNRPHFAGPAYVRIGSETKDASDEQLNVLIAERSSKVREIRKWIGKTISASLPEQQMRGNHTYRLEDCNEFWITYRNDVDAVYHWPLPFVELSFEAQGERLKLILRDR